MAAGPPQVTHQHTPSSHSPACPTVQLHTRVGVADAEGEIRCEGQKRLRPEALYELLVRAQAAYQKQPGPLSAARPPHPIPCHKLRALTVLMLQHCSCQGQGCRCWDEGEVTFKESGASLDLTLRPSAPTIWDQGLDLPLIGDGP